MPASPTHLCLKVPLSQAACQGNQFPRMVELMAFQPDPQQLPLPLVYFDDAILEQVIDCKQEAHRLGIYGGAAHNWIANRVGITQKEVKMYLQQGRDIELAAYARVTQQLQVG